jgi:hypothetical protein
MHCNVTYWRNLPTIHELIHERFAAFGQIPVSQRESYQLGHHAALFL